jgi:hypothetical protein
MFWYINQHIIINLSCLAEYGANDKPQHVGNQTQLFYATRM